MEWNQKNDNFVHQRNVPNIGDMMKSPPRRPASSNIEHFNLKSQNLIWPCSIPASLSYESLWQNELCSQAIKTLTFIELFSLSQINSSNNLHHNTHSHHQQQWTPALSKLLPLLVDPLTYQWACGNSLLSYCNAVHLPASIIQSFKMGHNNVSFIPTDKSKHTNKITFSGAGLCDIYKIVSFPLKKKREITGPWFLIGNSWCQICVGIQNFGELRKVIPFHGPVMKILTLSENDLRCYNQINSWS